MSKITIYIQLIGFSLLLMACGKRPVSTEGEIVLISPWLSIPVNADSQRNVGLDSVLWKFDNSMEAFLVGYPRGGAPCIKLQRLDLQKRTSTVEDGLPLLQEGNGYAARPYLLNNSDEEVFLIKFVGNFRNVHYRRIEGWPIPSKIKSHQVSVFSGVLEVLDRRVHGEYCLAKIPIMDTPANEVIANFSQSYDKRFLSYYSRKGYPNAVIYLFKHESSNVR